MLAQLTKNERQNGLLIAAAVAICGLAMAAVGRNDPIGIHGGVVVIFAVLCAFAIIAQFYAPEPSESRLENYYDDPTKVGIILAMGWAVIGLFVGDWVAWLLVYPEMTFDAPWASFGRIRPVHTTGVIFGFGGNQCDSLPDKRNFIFSKAKFIMNYRTHLVFAGNILMGKDSDNPVQF